MRKALMLIAAVGAFLALTVASRGNAADLFRVSLVPGADGGSTAQVIGAWLPGNQFMVSCPNNSVTYRLCPAADAGGCTATSTDAPVQGDKQVDLCAPSGYSSLSLYKQFDGGNPSCSVFLVTPKTVCQTP
ncbi:MAG: hypothetical protein IPJ65_42745 [Archangiaceae bacterium]|nr:hypothetical protein [Archangiaceae bacterium]